MNQDNYPNWICLPCGNRYGRKRCGVATWHQNKCDICGQDEMVTEPRDFGHLNDYWIDAYNLRMAMESVLKEERAYQKTDTISPDTNTPAPAKEYRTLNDGEIVMDGDEFWSEDRRWIPATSIGQKVTSYTHKMYRRLMTETSSQTTDTCPDCSNILCDCGIPAGYTPTPRTDKAAYYMGREGEHRDSERWCDLLNESRAIERELAAAQEEIDMMGIRYAAAEMHHGNNMQEVTEQRDRLAEGLKWIAGWNHQLFDETTAMQMRDKAEQALQSINQTTEP